MSTLTMIVDRYKASYKELLKCADNQSPFDTTKLHQPQQTYRADNWLQIKTPQTHILTSVFPFDPKKIPRFSVFIRKKIELFWNEKDKRSEWKMITKTGTRFCSLKS